MATSTVYVNQYGNGKKGDGSQNQGPRNIDPPVGDVTPPDLTMQTTWTADTSDKDHPKWSAGPAITLTKSDGGTSTGEPPQPPAVRDFKVSTGEIVDKVNSLLTTLNTQVADYEKFKKYVDEHKSWVFCTMTQADAGSDPYAGDVHQEAQGNGYSIAGYNWHETTTYYGASPNQVTEISTYMDNVLKGCGDTIHMAGQFVLALDAAAQAYANGDYNATYPDPPKITKIFS